VDHHYMIRFKAMRATTCDSILQPNIPSMIRCKELWITIPHW